MAESADRVPAADPALAPESVAEGRARAPRKSPVRLWTDRSLPLRLATAVVAIPLLLWLIARGGVPFLLLVFLLIVLGLGEFYALMSAQGFRPYRWLGLGTGLAVPWFVYHGLPTHANLFLTAFLVGTMALELLRPRDHGVAPMSVTLFGVLYVGWLASHLLYLRELPVRLGLDYARGASFVLLAVLPTWACDTVAYAAGLLFGRRRLHPAVSPKKSVEGSLAGLAAALAATWLLSRTLVPELSLLAALVLGLATGVFALVGDLVESLLKRTSHAKDSATWIPGHGGVLDRFDSLFFTAPLVYYFLVLTVFVQRTP